MFFDEHPEFLETSTTANDIGRLNLRHEAIITDNLDVLAGARVLDIASHDARWTFAALQAGAAHVTAIEGRDRLNEAARATLTAKGVAPERYALVQGDVYEVLAREEHTVDVVLCLGFLYHTLRYNELLHGIRATGAPHVIVDTKVMTGAKQPTVRMVTDRNDIESMAIADRYSFDGKSLVGLPSVPAVRRMLGAYGYRVEKRFDWPQLLDMHPDIEHVDKYRLGGRVTVRAARGDRADVSEDDFLPEPRRGQGQRRVAG